MDSTEPAFPLVLFLGLVLVSAPVAVFFVPAFAAGRADRSFRTGLQAAVWTVTAIMPLTYALWLPEGLHRHAIDGKTLDGELVAPVGVNLTGALPVGCGGEAGACTRQRTRAGPLPFPRRPRPRHRIS